MSIIINGKRAMMSLPRRMNPEDFNKDYNSRRQNDIKDFINSYTIRVDEIINQMVRRGETITPEKVKQCLINGTVTTYTVKDLIKEHLELMAERTKKEITLPTYQRYVTTYQLLSEQIGNKEVSEVTSGDLQRFKTYVLNNHQTSTAYGYMARCKTLFKYAVDNGRITTSPMASIKLNKGEKKPDILSEEDYQRLLKKNIKIERLEKVRDLYVLAAASGLAYCDLMLLEPSDIKKDKNGNTYIEKQRKKTGVTYTSVVLKEGVQILDKYNNDITPLKKSNQRLNGYLQELQDICGIETRLHMHTARHYYCSRLIMSGVPIAIVQRAMGHSKITTTQAFYTHLTTESVISNITCNQG